MTLQESSEITTIPVSRLKFALDKYNYRIYSEDEYDEDDDKIKELMESIKEVGLINPITVTNNNNDYEIVAGHRRFIACKSLGFNEIPCIVLKPDNDDARNYVIGLVENLQRNDMKPLEEAIGIKKYQEQFNIKTIAELARKVGKSEHFVESRLLMLKLPEHLQNEINNKTLPLKKTEYIIRHIVNDSLREELLDFIVEKKLTSSETDTIIDLTVDYEKTFQQFHELSKPELKTHDITHNFPVNKDSKHGLSLKSMMKQHDIQFVEGYLRLDPKTFDNRGKYSKTTRTVKKLIHSENKYSRNLPVITEYLFKKYFFDMVDIIDFLYKYDSLKKGVKYGVLRMQEKKITEKLTKTTYKRLLDFCVIKDILKQENNKYFVTDKGKIFLEKVKEIFDMIA